MKRTAKRDGDDAHYTTKKHFLKTKRFDAMYIPNTSWDFFDAFNSSKPSQLAFTKDEISYDNLDKYLKLTNKANIEEYRQENAIDQRPLPPLLTELLKLQARSGKYESLEAVCYLLEMPIEVVKFEERPFLQEWEKATALALAAMRQFIEYFDDIVEQHDLSVQWVPSTEFISDAREIYIGHQGTAGVSSLSALFPAKFESNMTLPFGESTEFLSKIEEESAASPHEMGFEGEMQTLSLITDASTAPSTERRNREEKRNNTLEERSQEKDENSSSKREFHDFSTILSNELNELQDSSFSQASSPLKDVLSKLAGSLDHNRINQQKLIIEQLEVSLGYSLFTVHSCCLPL
jgi:hypothetical protein